MAHIPDGFLSAPVTAGTLAAAAGLVLYAAHRSRRQLDERAAPTLGLATAAVFAAQMVNFPVAAGTSGHLMGGTLVAVIFGPWAGFLVMTAVLIAQAVIFADGGITALGANIVNIAGVGALLGYSVYAMAVRLVGPGPRRSALAAALGAYAAMLLIGVAAGLELGVSGIAPTRLAVGAMAGVHAIIGLAEATITGLVVAALVRRQPDLIHGRPMGDRAVRPARPLVLGALGAMAVAAGILSVVLSASPDSLERVAIDLGFAESGTGWVGAPFPDYEAWLAGAAGTLIAAALGVTLLFVGTGALLRAFRTLRRREA
ncbi:MAG: energy-coupling factor ABC transporter permease [Gemmatimonadetes bacterium]|uniref:Energy-coupling factor ABC transporter permease n=1 Tax=Candidatus Kutchimonas denitrificans TaxID=3056748 RepID=A0AAE4ZCR3_9BACT|nr:energy-coupling factor ABC transporter permease [Gemmatimonadota bacterium]NIR75415.1 energy-coupling factor ABC transporter permease [Candidatus Kutchimonas denitrificans]NIS01729.1 energy-coupling factor ABC transporter permease [Gemmatimonadota bacterium]NIT67511.1 energy-coupling factor ABC transporter permease [Gemmatimonadota bacterium]NIU53374.1 cobalt transporter [Gemmatimonadota bacterium]